MKHYYHYYCYYNYLCYYQNILCPQYTSLSGYLNIRNVHSSSSDFSVDNVAIVRKIPEHTLIHTQAGVIVVANMKAFRCFEGLKIGRNGQDLGTPQDFSKRRGRREPPWNQVTSLMDS